MNEQSDANLERLFEQQKEIHGKSATFLWIVIGVVLFVIEPTARFWSWQAAVYFLIGMFVAAIIFGSLGYVTTRLVAMLFQKAGARSVQLVVPIGILLFVLDAVLIYFVARWTIRVLFA